MAHPQEKVGKTYKGLCETEGHDEDPTDDQDGLICQDRGSQPHLTDHQDRGSQPNLIDGQAEEPTVNQDGLICQDRGSQPNLIDGQAEEPTVNQEGLRQPESLEDAKYQKYEGKCNDKKEEMDHQIDQEFGEKTLHIQKKVRRLEREYIMSLHTFARKAIRDFSVSSGRRSTDQMLDDLCHLCISATTWR